MADKQDFHDPSITNGTGKFCYTLIMDVTPIARAVDRDHDSLERFVFEDAPIHGRIVHLDATWRAVLERRAYPEPVRELLGEFMAAAALLTAMLKFDGRL